MHFSQSFVEASSESPEKVRKQNACVQSDSHALLTERCVLSLQDVMRDHDSGRCFLFAFRGHEVSK